MNKALLRIGTALCALLLMTGCGGLVSDMLEQETAIAPETEPVAPTAQEILTQVEVATKQLGEYVIEMDLTMVIAKDGVAVSSESTVVAVESAKETSEEYYSYYEFASTVSYELDGTEYSQELMSISAYLDGKAFESNGTGDQTARIFGTMTPAQYLEYYSTRDKNTDIEGFDPMACADIQALSDENGGWVVLCSGYDEQSVAALAEDLVGGGEDFGAQITDVEISLYASADYELQKITYAFVFDAEQTPAPRLDVTLHVRACEGKSFIAERIDESAYTQVEDLCMVWELERLIEQKCNEQKAAFTLQIEQTVTDYKLVGVTLLRDKYKAEYGVRNGKYYYELDCDLTKGESAKYSYYDGVCQKTIRDGTTESFAQSEQVAVSTINDLINDPSVDYNASKVIGLEQTENGVWVATLLITEEELEEDRALMESIEGRYRHSTHTVTITVKDGELSSLKTTYMIEGRRGSGSDQRKYEYRSLSKLEFS